MEEYLRVFETIAAEGLDSNVSIKLTLLGLKIDEGFCRDNIERIVATAKEHGNFVRIDMEDHTTTDATLRIYHELHARYGNVGVVLQAYMRRTPVATSPRCRGGRERAASARGSTSSRGRSPGRASRPCGRTTCGRWRS